MRIVDLFSGAGGLTFGFYYNLINGQFVRNENCDIIFANEFDHAAAEAFRVNFPDVNMIERDIKELQYDEIIPLIGDEEVDLIIGGPPCQSYSTIGRTFVYVARKVCVYSVWDFIYYYNVLGVKG